MSGNRDYLGYCEHGVLIFWAAEEVSYTKKDAAGVFEMRRGSVEQARKELSDCAQCRAQKKVKR